MHINYEMITLINLVNIWHLNIVTNFLLLVMRTFKVYSIGSFEKYITVLLTIVTMVCIMSPEPMYLITGNLATFTHFPHLSPLPLETMNLSIFYEFGLLRFHM